MEPATAVVSLIGLLIPFIQQRQNSREADRSQTLEGFKEWLRRKEHSAVLSAIESNTQLSQEIDRLLRADLATISTQLEELNQNVVQIMLHTQGWHDLATTFPVRDQLSEQSLNIIVEMEKLEATFAVEIPDASGRSRDLYTDNGLIEIKEARFLDDDLVQLVSLGLLGQDYTNQGDLKYTVTRLGSAIARERLAK